MSKYLGSRIGGIINNQINVKEWEFFIEKQNIKDPVSRKNSTIFKEKWITSIRSALWNKDELLHPKYKRKPGTHPLAGHCYIACEVYDYVMRTYFGVNSKPHYIKIKDATHWFLRYDDWQIIDLTYDQFENIIPYDSGIGCGFQTKNLSKRGTQAWNITRQIFDDLFPSAMTHNNAYLQYNSNQIFSSGTTVTTTPYYIKFATV